MACEDALSLPAELTALRLYSWDLRGSAVVFTKDGSVVNPGVIFRNSLSGLPPEHLIPGNVRLGIGVPPQGDPILLPDADQTRGRGRRCPLLRDSGHGRGTRPFDQRAVEIAYGPNLVEIASPVSNAPSRYSRPGTGWGFNGKQPKRSPWSADKD